jgi:hypothetical protein
MESGRDTDSKEEHPKKAELQSDGTMQLPDVHGL